MQNILFLGDSLTAGYGIGNPAQEAMPALIAKKITAANLDYNVINAGLSGDTSGGGLSRIDYWLSRPVSIFVLELGINDIIRGISPQTTMDNLQAIITKVKSKCPEVEIALMGMKMPAYIHSPMAIPFNTIYSRLAEINHVRLVPFYLDGVARKPHLNLPDGLHPNADGYKVIAERIWPVIQGLIADNKAV